MDPSNPPTASFSTDYGPEIENSLMPIVLLLASHMKLLIVLPLVCGILAFSYSKLSDPLYSATVRILPPQYNENTVNALSDQFGGESQLGNSALTLQNPVDLFVGVLKSRSILNAVALQLQLSDHYGITSGFDVRRKLSRNTDILAGKDGIVSVTVMDTNPQKAADIANAYVDEFYAFSSRLAAQQADRRLTFFELAMAAAQERLLEADLKLSDVERQTGFTRLDGQDQAIVQAVAELRAEISAREVQLRTMSSYATETNPDVVLIRTELNNLRVELADILGAGSATGAAPFPQLENVPDIMLEHTRSRRDVEYWESIVLVLGKFGELGKIDERRDMSLFQVLDRAIAAEDKSKPRTMINVVLAMVGAFFGAVMWVLAAGYVAHRSEQSDKFQQQWQELKHRLLHLGRAA